MKFFGARSFMAAQGELSVIGRLLARRDMRRDAGTGGPGHRPRLRDQAFAEGGAIAYPVAPASIRTFAASGLPFLTFYEFGDLAGWFRDVYFAPDQLEGYKQDAGVEYNVWTHEARSLYLRHVFLDKISKDMAVSFSIPALDSLSWFPLQIRLYDSQGLYFQQDQKLVVDRIRNGRSQLTSWKRIPKLSATLSRLHQLGSADV